jgi:ABC transporter substrate binding protein
MSMSNALPVCRLMTSSNLVPRRIGKSAGFSPLRMRPARRSATAEFDASMLPFCYPIRRASCSSAATPVALGLVASLNRPGGNATGVNVQLAELVTKRFGMLRELAPGANRFVALVNPNTAFTDAVVKDLQASASALGLPIEILRAATGREIDAAFANVVQKPGGAGARPPDPPPPPPPEPCPELTKEQIKNGLASIRAYRAKHESEWVGGFVVTEFPASMRRKPPTPVENAATTITRIGDGSCRRRHC